MTRCKGPVPRLIQYHSHVIPFCPSAINWMHNFSQFPSADDNDAATAGTTPSTVAPTSSINSAEEVTVVAQAEVDVVSDQAHTSLPPLHHPCGCLPCAIPSLVVVTVPSPLLIDTNSFAPPPLPLLSPLHSLRPPRCQCRQIHCASASASPPAV